MERLNIEDVAPVRRQIDRTADRMRAAGCASHVYFAARQYAEWLRHIEACVICRQSYWDSEE